MALPSPVLQERRPDAAPPLDAGTRAWYASGQFAEGLKNEAFTLFLLFYYTAVLGLPGLLAGQAILIALLFDAVIPCSASSPTACRRAGGGAIPSSTRRSSRSASAST